MALDGLDLAERWEIHARLDRVDVDARWAGINVDVAQAMETAALATGLHHQAAAVIDEIEDEVAAISALLGRAR